MPLRLRRHPGLTERRARFVDEYMVDGNATQAAIRAGYAKGQSAEVEGYRLLRDAQVLAAITAAKSARARRLEVTADWIIMQQLSLHAATVGHEPEVARKALRDVGDGIGMYVEKREVAFPQLSAGERDARIAALLGMAQQRALMSGPADADANGADDRVDR